MRKSVLEYLEETAKNKNNQTALVGPDGDLTWGELYQGSRRIGASLAGKTEGRRPVPVLMEKGSWTVAAFLGAVWAGCFYVPLNPELPDARLCQVLEVLQADLLVTDEEHRERALDLTAGKETEIYTVRELLAEEGEETILDRRQGLAIDTDPLYANFTSGSTGVPKGVLVSHRSVLDFIDVFTETFGITGEDRMANQAPLDFDVSVKDLYSCLKTGATLLLVPRELFSRPAALLDFLCEKKTTVMVWAVSALCLITTFHGLDYRVPESVRMILFSGEAMPLKHLRIWEEKLPEAEFVNLYGPTEITCNCTYYRVVRGEEYPEGLPIGRAFPNERVFLLDEDNREIRPEEIGKRGEICVSGSALALGYYRAPAQTAEHFVQNPLNTSYEERIYRTGDLGSYAADGNLLFHGRKDFQIKYMGHRIELEEVERAMAKLPGVDRCCCLFDEEKGRLYGFYCGTAEKKELSAKLKESLPVFMVPGRLCPLEEMPLTKNGKIDRKALREMFR